ncbi:hypothetical protein ACIHCQ_19900 [Streptomyces sp. NPDC052236]|uniref:hypothetical protein n=1 Tax=Streptomyces sp. NPDC052236 TaxID=3365686 RepID=UPI0037CF62C6
MQGHGYAPPQPNRPSNAMLIVVRVLFVAVALLTFGFLSWATMLRIAIMRRRPLDWALFWICLALVIAAIVIIGEFTSEAELPDGAEAPATTLDYICLVILLGLALGVPTHYLVADIRHYQRPRPGLPSAAPVYTQPAGPYSAPTVPYGVPTPPPGYGYPAAQPHTQSQPPVQPPSPTVAQPRLDQVRAELDELSDYLRQHPDGGQNR